MSVTQGCSKCIGGVLRRHTVQTQYRYDHVLHLFFACRSGAHNSLLYLTRRVFKDFYTVSKGRANGGRAGMSQFQGAAGVLVHEYALDRDDIRAILFDDTADGFEYLPESVSECAIDAFDGSARNVLRFGANKIDDAKARQAGARIDSENATFCCQLSLDLSQHVFADIGVAIHFLNIVQVFEHVEHLDHGGGFFYTQLSAG